MKKKLVVVSALTTDIYREEHLCRLLQTYNVIVIAPLSSPMPQWMASTAKYIQVSYPYTKISLHEAVCEIHAWEALNKHIDGVMPLMEGAVEFTAILIEALNKHRNSDPLPLPGMSAKTAQITRNKYLFRQLVAPFSKNISSLLLRSPEDILVAYSNMTFPAILKPAKGMNSTLVRRINTKHDLRVMFDQVLESDQSDEWEKDGFVLEEFFEGDEVDVDGWARDGSVEFMVVNDNIPMGPPDFHELGGCYPSQLSKQKLDVIRKLTCDVVDALGDMNGAFHFEAKVNDNLEVFAIEMNARVGGLEAPYAMEAMTGYYLYDVHAQLATRQRVTKTTVPLYKAVASRNLYLDFECDLLGIHHLDPNTIRDEGIVIIRYLDKPRNYIPDQASASCVVWLAVGGSDGSEAKRKIKNVEKLIEYEYELLE